MVATGMMAPAHHHDPAPLVLDLCRWCQWRLQELLMGMALSRNQRPTLLTRIPASKNSLGWMQLGALFLFPLHFAATLSSNRGITALEAATCIACASEE